MCAAGPSVTGPVVRESYCSAEQTYAPACSLLLGLSKLTGAIPWQGYLGVRDWCHSWGQVRLKLPDIPTMLEHSMSHGSAGVPALAVLLGWGALSGAAALMSGCSSESHPASVGPSIPERDSAGRPLPQEEPKPDHESEGRQVIDTLVTEYQRAPEKYAREAAGIGAALESTEAEAARMRRENRISLAEWDAACQALMRGRPLDQPLYNRHVLEHILRSR